MNTCSMSASACQGPAASWFQCQHLSSLAHPKNGGMITSIKLKTSQPLNGMRCSSSGQTISNMPFFLHRVSLSMHLASFMRLSIRSSIRGHPAQLTTPRPRTPRCRFLTLHPWLPWLGSCGKPKPQNRGKSHQPLG